MEKQKKIHRLNNGYELADGQRIYYLYLMKNKLSKKQKNKIFREVISSSPIPDVSFENIREELPKIIFMKNITPQIMVELYGGTVKGTPPNEVWEAPTTTDIKDDEKTRDAIQSNIDLLKKVITI